MMSLMMANPRGGHFKQLFHVFGCLKSNHNAEMVFDPTLPEIDMDKFPKEDWSHTPYADFKEQLPHDTRKQLGFGFRISAYVDSIPRRSRTGFIVFLDSAPIYWLSRKQLGLETSSFGSEFMVVDIPNLITRV